jgi:hypothetical protein
MHGKEQAIAPVFLAILNVIVAPAEGVDTDALGTFSGETPRRGTMLETAIAKARLGIERARLPFGIASEGSFGPHPLFPIIPAGFELLALVDDERGTTVHESLVIDGGFVAQIGLRVSFPFPQTDLAYCLCDRYAKSG